MAKSRHERAEAALTKLRTLEFQGRRAKSRAERVETAIEKIRALHALGRSLPRKQEHKKVYGRGIIDSERTRLGLDNEDTLRKARQLADPEDGYSLQELRELIADIRWAERRRPDRLRQPGAGTGQDRAPRDREPAVFERTHLVRLLTIRPKAERRSLLRECLRGGWSTAELEREIAERYGPRRQGGRRPILPGDEAAVLTQVERMCEKWRRWHANFTATGLAEKCRLAATIGRACATIRALQQSVLGELKRRRPGRRPRDLPPTGPGRTA